ncbi:MAG: hypothetical protein ACEPOV_00005 [Hyphomicrobiales bacterium]
MKRILYPILFVGIIILTGCNKNLNQEIIGKWSVTAFEPLDTTAASLNELAVDKVKKSQEEIQLSFITDTTMRIITPSSKFDASYSIDNDSLVYYKFDGSFDENLLGKFDGTHIKKIIDVPVIRAKVIYSKSE